MTHPAPNLVRELPRTADLVVIGGGVIGAATAFFAARAGLRATALVASGTTIYVGGGFTSIGGQPRNRIAALDATTGLAAAWNPNAGNGAVYSLAVSGTTVYAGGYFASIGNSPQSYLAVIGDVSTPTLLSFVSAQAASDRVKLTWFAADGRNLGVTMYRRTTADDWSALAQATSDGTGRIVYEDTDVSAGTRTATDSAYAKANAKCSWARHG